MKVKIIEEAGKEAALAGMSLSYKDRALDLFTWWEGQRTKAYKRADLLAHRGGGHNKFLESVVVWIDLEGPRDFWSEFDTYRAGTTKQSESTMHTLSKRAPTAEDFEVDTPVEMIETFITFWCKWKDAGGTDIARLKNALPEGFLQRRMVCTNYKTLQNIIAQRHDHRLHYWVTFCQEVMAQVEFPQWLDPHYGSHE